MSDKAVHIKRDGNFLCISVVNNKTYTLAVSKDRHVKFSRVVGSELKRYCSDCSDRYQKIMRKRDEQDHARLKKNKPV